MLTWAVRQILFWTLGAAAAVAILGGKGGVVRVDAGRTAPGTIAATAAPASARTMTIRAGAGGHFRLVAEVDGTPVHFLVDTGASGVVLSPEDAERIGLVLGDRDFTLTMRTAGGFVRAAPVSLREVRIGALSQRDVEAMVNAVPIGVSLLGLSFLSRLDGYRVEGDRLILSW
jgi:aspartyl protease family protein